MTQNCVFGSKTAEKQAESLGIATVLNHYPIFKYFVESLLVPVLHPGDQVIMDNVRFHKVDGVAQAIEGAGATVEFLPPYSPDFSPIENGFSKIKETLRTLGSKTLETFVDSVKQALTAISTNDTKGWFQHCGYRIPSG